MSRRSVSTQFEPRGIPPNDDMMINPFRGEQWETSLTVDEGLSMLTVIKMKSSLTSIHPMTSPAPTIQIQGIGDRTSSVTDEEDEVQETSMDLSSFNPSSDVNQ